MVHETRSDPVRLQLHSLPPEIVAHILASAAPTEDATDPVSRRQRWRSLDRISRVCSEWRRVAQRIMWAHGKVRMYHAKDFGPFVDLVVGQPAQGIAQFVRRLDLTMWGESADRLAELLALCDNLEEVVLEHVDRVRFDQVVTPNLRSFSARQCTFISSVPFAAAPYPTVPVYSNLHELDLRFNSFRRDSLPTHATSFPRLRHLLFFTGSLDQSTQSVHAFLSAVAPLLKSVSLDQTGWDALYGGRVTDEDDSHSEIDPDGIADDHERSSRPSRHGRLLENVSTIGLYWDAAALSLVGSALVVGSASLSSTRDRLTCRRGQRPLYLHVSLYPLAIASLFDTFAVLFDQIAHEGRRAARLGPSSTRSVRHDVLIEHVRFEQTFRHLGLEDNDDQDDDDDDDDEEVSTAHDADRDEDEHDERAGESDERTTFGTTSTARPSWHSQQRQRRNESPNRRQQRRVPPTWSSWSSRRWLREFVSLVGSVGPDSSGAGSRAPPAHVVDAFASGTSVRNETTIKLSVDASQRRGTAERGFDTSWWRYARCVENCTPGDSIASLLD